MAQSGHLRTVKKLTIVAVLMFGFGYAMVPLYDIFCDITGLNGRTNDGPVENAGDFEIDESREVTIEFIATVDSRGAWKFNPKVSQLTVNPGKIYEIDYFAQNLHGKAVDGQAVPSVVPGVVAKYLQKIECFCFNRQPFEAGESKDMKVKFVVDPDIPKDYSRLTLSYTLFTADPG